MIKGIKTLLINDIKDLRNKFNEMKQKSFRDLFLSLPSILFYLSELGFKWFLFFEIKLVSFFFYTRFGFFLFFIIFLQFYNPERNDLISFLQLFTGYLISAALFLFFFLNSEKGREWADKKLGKEFITRNVGNPAQKALIRIGSSVAATAVVEYVTSNGRAEQCHRAGEEVLKTTYAAQEKRKELGVPIDERSLKEGETKAMNLHAQAATQRGMVTDALRHETVTKMTGKLYQAVFGRRGD